MYVSTLRGICQSRLVHMLAQLVQKTRRPNGESVSDVIHNDTSYAVYICSSRAGEARQPLEHNPMACVFGIRYANLLIQKDLA